MSPAPTLGLPRTLQCLAPLSMAHICLPLKMVLILYIYKGGNSIFFKEKQMIFAPFHPWWESEPVAHLSGSFLTTQPSSSGTATPAICLSKTVLLIAAITGNVSYFSVL